MVIDKQKEGTRSMNTKLMLTATGVLAVLGVAAPAAARPAKVELAMADYARETAAPDGSVREAELRARYGRHTAAHDCGDCKKANCVHCADADCDKAHCAGSDKAPEPASGGSCNPANHHGATSSTDA
jgi:hypothetical protein